MCLTSRATVTTLSGCLGSACDGFHSIFGGCSQSIGTEGFETPGLFVSCLCQNPTAYQSYITACYDCYSSIGLGASTSLLASIIGACQSYSSLTGLSTATVPPAVIQTSTAETSQSAKSTATVTREWYLIYFLLAIFWVPLAILLYF
jgi:hypothetical protein